MLTDDQIFTIIDQQLNKATNPPSGAPFTMSVFALNVQGPSQSPQNCIFDNTGVPRAYLQRLAQIMQDGNGTILFDGTGFHWHENPPIPIPTVFVSPTAPPNVSMMTGRVVDAFNLDEAIRRIDRGVGILLQR